MSVRVIYRLRIQEPRCDLGGHDLVCGRSRLLCANFDSGDESRLEDVKLRFKMSPESSEINPDLPSTFRILTNETPTLREASRKIPDPSWLSDGLVEVLPA